MNDMNEMKNIDNKKNIQEYVYNVREVRSVRELVETSCALYSDRCAFLYRENGTVTEITYKKLMSDIKALGAYLCHEGFEGKKVAVTGKNSYGWALTYLTVFCSVGIIVPIDKELDEKEVDYIIENSETSVVMISPELEEKFENCASSCRKLYMSKIGEYIKAGEELITNGENAYENHTVDPYALAALLYTSGTTGVAKGVMLSQNNIASDLVHILRSVKVYPYDRSISVLPLHHTYESTIGLLGMLFAGASIAFNDSLKSLQKDLAEFKPTIFVTVPAILERFHKLILAKYKKIKGGENILKLQKAAAKGLGFGARKKIFSAVNEAFGGKVRLCLCGAAPLDPALFRDYELFGIKMYIGYGLTETAPVCLMHSDFYRCADDNGYPMAGTYAKIVDVNADGIGELIYKGPNVMLGYYKNEEETKKVLRDGWFYTGDLARQNENGTFTIVGRVKSMIVTSGGKKVFPEELEAKLSESPYVSECLVFATIQDGKEIITASVYPDEEAVERAISRAVNITTKEEYEKEKKDLIMSLITELNDKVPSYKTIRRLIVRKEEFVKTTTRKIKRNAPENLV